MAKTDDPASFALCRGGLIREVTRETYSALKFARCFAIAPSNSSLRSLFPIFATTLAGRTRVTQDLSPMRLSPKVVNSEAPPGGFPTRKNQSNKDREQTEVYLTVA